MSSIRPTNQPAEQIKEAGEEEAKAAMALVEVSIADLAENYGDIPLIELQSKAVTGRKWTEVKSLTSDLKNQEVLIRGRVQAVHAVSEKIAFVVVREVDFTVRCVLMVSEGKVSEQMVKFATALSHESIVDVQGFISAPNEAIEDTSQKVEIQVRKIYCISRAVPTLPNCIKDTKSEEASKDGEKQRAPCDQYIWLNYRNLDLRFPVNHAIFQLSCEIEYIFRVFLKSEGFRGIHTPKLLGETIEGGAAVFRLDYKGKPAYLAQSTQIHKQMSISGDFKRVFEVGPLFRAEDSITNRHLCEFTGLDAEMEIKEHYSEVMDIIDRLFVAIFDHLNDLCKGELKVISRQYPFQPLKYLRKTLQLTFAEGVQMLKDAGIEVDPYGDLSTETERKLGELVCDKYDTEFYILHRYPLALRPFYTMPCYDDPLYSNSFDVFIRGEEIISGAQHVHDPKLLAKRAEACGIDVKTVATYFDSLEFGTSPHGGFGLGLERVVMLFCNLNNIRKASLFPSDPQWLTP